jgi:hypothetical protein
VSDVHFTVEVGHCTDHLTKYLVKGTVSLSPTHRQTASVKVDGSPLGREATLKLLDALMCEVETKIERARVEYLKRG